MKVIWKYNIDITDTQVLNTKADAKFLTVQMQDYYPAIWVEVDTENGNEEYVIEVFGTGNPMTDHDRQYLGTIQESNFVWHVYVRDESIMDAVVVYEQ